MPILSASMSAKATTRSFYSGESHLKNARPSRPAPQIVNLYQLLSIKSERTDELQLVVQLVQLSLSTSISTSLIFIDFYFSFSFALECTIDVEVDYPAPMPSTPRSSARTRNRLIIERGVACDIAAA